MRDCFRDNATSKQPVERPFTFSYRLGFVITIIACTSCSGRVTAPHLSSPVQVTSQSQPSPELERVQNQSDSALLAVISGACLEAWRKELAGDEAGAVKQLKELDRKYPRVSTVRFMLGQVMEHSGKKAEAIKYYREAVSQSDFDSMHVFKLAESLRTAGNAKDAIPYYRKLLNGAPDFTEGKLGLAKSLAAVDPKSPEAHELFMEVFKLAESLRATDKANDAIPYYREIVLANPKFAPGQLGLAKALLDVDPNSKEALGVLRQIVKDEPKNKEALAALAGKH